MRNPTIREAARAALAAMDALCGDVNRQDYGLAQVCAEHVIALDNARYILRDALARDEEAHSLAMLKALADGAAS